MITEDWVHTKFLADKNRCTTSSARVEKDDKKWLISKIITRVPNASRN